MCLKTVIFKSTNSDLVVLKLNTDILTQNLWRSVFEFSSCKICEIGNRLQTTQTTHVLELQEFRLFWMHKHSLFWQLPIQMHTLAYHVILLARKTAMTTALANHNRVFHVLSRERKGCLIPKISHLYDFRSWGCTLHSLSFESIRLWTLQEHN